MFIKIVLAVLVVVGGLGYIIYEDVSNTNKVKSGEKILVCEFKDGTREVNPSKIKNYSNGTWHFTNGHASNCYFK